MHKKLVEIIEEKKKEVAKLKREGIMHPDVEVSSVRDFKGAISRPGRINVIAEIKFASPSAGMIREKAEPEKIGIIYEGAGASAISLLTDRRYFHGDISYLPQVRMAVSLPVLRKDFIIDVIQVEEASVYGADAALLIARILSARQLKELIGACREMGPAPLTEVHDRADIDKALECGADIIGINSRDLDTFEIDMNTAFSLTPFIPEGCIIVGESGINDEGDVRALKGSRINAVLVGSALMRDTDIEGKTGKIVKAGSE
ncbi:MAG: indole-3-glycerol phosphate synthase TrpC [Deltaproteobacteria bacterium]|nr:indole-3-glycerol phosphate synthase TrpC [Deltaproteobacteria bacterium]